MPDDNLLLLRVEQIISTSDKAQIISGARRLSDHWRPGIFSDKRSSILHDHLNAIACAYSLRRPACLKGQVTLTVRGPHSEVSRIDVTKKTPDLYRASRGVDWGAPWPVKDRGL